METPKSAELAHIGKSVVIKGELSGSEDLYLDGHVQGSIELRGHNLTIGPNGQVRANVNAKGVFIQGKLEGDVEASDRVELRKSAIMTGDIVTQRVAIEDGAYLKGKVDSQKQTSKFEVSAEPKWESPKATVSVAQPVTSAAAAGSGSTSTAAQTAKVEQKK
jgi:cytoskeletal protein CcmA (bactofilin family)